MSDHDLPEQVLSAARDDMTAFRPDQIPPFAGLQTRKRSRDRRRYTVAAVAMSAVAVTAVVLAFPGGAGDQLTTPLASAPAVTPSATSAAPSSAGPTVTPSTSAPIAAASSPTAALTSSTARPGVAVNTKNVAGVRIGTPAAEAERRLRATLGRPTSTDPLPGCYGESGRSLTWSTLTVYLSDSASGPVLLSGWTVLAGVGRFRWQLPYAVDAGDRVSKVFANVPGAEGALPEEGENTMYFVVRTQEAPGLTWTSTTSNERGRIAEIDFRGEACD